MPIVTQQLNCMVVAGSTMGLQSKMEQRGLVRPLGEVVCKGLMVWIRGLETREREMAYQPAQRPPAAQATLSKQIHDIVTQASCGKESPHQ